MKSKIHVCKICSCSKKKLKAHIRLEHNITEKEYYDLYLKQPFEGICSVCNKPTQFIRWTDGYRTHCSTQCSSLDKEVQNKNKSTNLNLYGVEHNWNKGILRQNQEKTMMEKYGVYHNWKSGELRSKEKLKISKDEQYFMDELDKLNISYKYRYFDKVNYPYECDFYLDQYNIYIELNISPFHNNHFYDNTCQDDIDKLQELMQKAKTSSWYESAVRIWLKDVEKRDTAKKNNLNYVVLWSRQEIEFYISYLKEIM